MVREAFEQSLTPVQLHVVSNGEQAMHANAYIVKLSDPDGFAQVIQQIAGCFLGLITLPP